MNQKKKKLKNKIKHSLIKTPKVKHWGRFETPKRILIVSDLHVGSTTALCSEHPVTSDLGTTYNPNPLQKQLFRAWKDMIKALKGTVDLLVVNGECIDGANVKQVGQQSWTTNLEDQMNDAKKLIEMIPYRKVLLLRGSGYHVQVDGTNFEEIMASKLKNVVKYKAYGGQGSTDYFAFVKIYGKVFNFTHHIGFSKAEANRTGALAKEMKGMHFQHDTLGRADGFIRSHAHYFVHVEFANTHGVITPAWKFPDAHLFRGGLAGTVPDVGAVEFRVYKDGTIEFEKYIAEINIKAKVIDIED
jgi:hypothetical protein